MILADLDNDGDMDVVCNNFNEGPLLFRNEAAAPRVAVSLKGLAPNTEGIGAEIRLIGPGPVQRQEMIAGGRYLSSDQPLRSFAAPGRSLAMEIKWPSGRLSHLEVQPNYHYAVAEADAPPGPPPPAGAPIRPLFEDWSGRLSHVHYQPPCDDFNRQPSLPWGLSHGGPGVCWFDFDSDGWEDLFVSSARGGKPALYLNHGASFVLATNFFPQVDDHDFTGLAAANIGNASRLMVGFSDCQPKGRQRSGVEGYGHSEPEGIRRDAAGLGGGCVSISVSPAVQELEWPCSVVQ